jgi:hypothetical protein
MMTSLLAGSALGIETKAAAEQRKERRRKLPPGMIQHGHTSLRAAGRPSGLDSAAI